MLNPIAPWITAPNGWSAYHAPAANTTATITRAAAGAGLRNVCDTLTFALLTTNAALGALSYVTVRDGASGVGTIIWQAVIGSPTAASGAQSRNISLSNVGLIGSLNTSMTFEFNAGPGVDNYEAVAATGHVQP